MTVTTENPETVNEEEEEPEPSALRMNMADISQMGRMEPMP